MHQSKDVIELWFGPVDQQGAPAAEKVAAWWKKDPEFDAQLRERFLDVLELASAGRLGWDQGVNDTLAEIIVLDQFSRNIHRDTASMYTADERARSLALQLITTGTDLELPQVYRMFVYMPLMHSEELSHQDEAIRCFEHLVADATGELQGMFRKNLEFSHAHRDIVAQFGRFPHRNAILGRETTPAETAFLAQPGSSF